MAQTSRRYVLLSLLMLWACPPLQAGISVSANDGELSETEVKSLGFFLKKIRFVPEEYYSKEYNLPNLYRICVEVEILNRSKRKVNIEWVYTSMNWDGPMEVDISPALPGTPKPEIKPYLCGDNRFIEKQKLKHKQSVTLEHLGSIYNVFKMDAPHDVIIKGSVKINGQSHEYKFKARVVPSEKVDSNFWS